MSGGRIAIFKAGPVVKFDGLYWGRQCDVNVVSVRCILYWSTPVRVEMKAGTKSVNQARISRSVSFSNGVCLELAGFQFQFIGRISDAQQDCFLW